MISIGDCEPDQRKNWLAKQMWSSGERIKFRGKTLILQSAEFALLTSLMHGFLQGDRGDVLQTVADAALLLPICKADELRGLLRRSDLCEPFKILTSTYDRLGLSDTLGNALMDRRHRVGQRYKEGREIIPATKPVRRCQVRPNVEKSLLRWPVFYRMWELLGRWSRLERLMLRLAGPFSRPLSAPATHKDEYNLRDCRVIDEIGGPGWGWPEPDYTCFWSDRADARLLIPLERVGDYLLVVRFADSRRESPNPSIDIFANGLHVTHIDFRKHSTSEYAFLVPGRILFGPWLELSLRPKRYLGSGAWSPEEWYSLKRCAPVQRLSVMDLPHLAALLENSQRRGTASEIQGAG